MLDELRARLLDAAEDDWVYFAEIESMILEIDGASDDLLRQAGEAAVQFVREGVIIPGTLTEAEGFVPWFTSPAESADRVRQEVDVLLRDRIDPRPGQICWFDVPTESPA
ncbi:MULTISPECIES: hypothetical protein [Actinoalloteichus]|uniref:Uncharacterized protein n=1 Tax=Actinoalloteichus fjordicus TaxID=1612552 RepID=A0AAC9LAU4_9PSEU|nr:MULTISPECIES: hypothetical protein [Actinoalloteichus]APU14161.1 hypothetical protein UA74_10490 [Actinoalloteichus fjordicus]APU20107.1 hypothetical protein UA75_10460 [Actinoalloteichus sp. GBA129-24]